MSFNMTIETKKKIIYISAYIFCLIFTPVILAGCIRHRISLWQDWWFYLPLCITGVIGCFCNAKTRNLIFLFQIPTALHGLFTMSIFRFLSEFDHYTIITTILWCILFALWHSHSTVSAWRMLGVTYLGFSYLFAYPSIWFGETWKDFISNTSGSISTSIAYMTSLLPTAWLCQTKNGYLKGTLTIIIIIYVFACGFYTSPSVYHRLQYGTYSGCIQKKATLMVRSRKGNQNTFKTFNGYHAHLIANNVNIWTVKKFEGLALQFRNQPVQFSILGVVNTPDKAKILLREHKTMHVTVPLYFISREKLKKSPLKANAYGDYICILKNDTLIYKGEADPTTRAIRFLSNELQP